MRLEDRELAGAVHLGDEVDLALVLDRHAAAVALALDAPGAQHRFGRDRQVAPAHAFSSRGDCRRCGCADNGRAPPPGASASDGARPGGPDLD